jgi:hypothetical protein
METFINRELEIAWAAGFFEGEGCFFASFQKPRQDGSRLFRTHASLTQKDALLLEKFKNIVGFGSICNNSKSTKAWKTSRVGEAAQLLALFEPWLSERRLNKAKELLEKEAKQTIYPVSKYCPNGHKYTPENTAIYPGRRGRICKICRAEYAKQWRDKQKEIDNG